MIKCLLTYSRDIDNNEEMEHIARYMNNSNVDVLALIKNKFFDAKIKMENLGQRYFNVEILSILWSQNIVRFNHENNLAEEGEFSNQNIVNYIKALLKEF
jgi:hypothetical protein